MGRGGALLVAMALAAGCSGGDPARPGQMATDVEEDCPAVRDFLAARLARVPRDSGSVDAVGRAQHMLLYSEMAGIMATTHPGCFSAGDRRRIEEERRRWAPGADGPAPPRATRPSPARGPSVARQPPEVAAGG